MNGHITENGTENSFLPKNKPVTANEYRLRTFMSTLNLLTHVLIGIVVGGVLVVVFRTGLPIGATQLHMVLCVIGYHLLIAQAIMSMSPNNGWSAHLRLVDRKRAHWILQVLGSGLAIAGSIIKMLDKNVHFNTNHGRFALVAFIFTVLAMINGLVSLYSYELRKWIPAKLPKMTHICFGVVAFGASSITLCYGLEKGFVMTTLGNGMSYTLITFTSISTFVIIISPFISFISKIRS